MTATTRTVTSRPNGWASWVVTAGAGDTIRARFTATGTAYGWCVIGTDGYEWLTSKPTFRPKAPVELRLLAPHAGKFRVGASIRGDVQVVIDVITPAPPAPVKPPAPVVPAKPAEPEKPRDFSVTPHWPIAGPMSAASVWRTRVEKAQVSTRSKELVADLVRQVRASTGGVAYFNGWQYDMPRYAVGADVPRVRVVFRDEQGKGYTPSQLYSTREERRGHFLEVPLDARMVPAKGSDASLSLWSPSTDELWCFWKLRRDVAADGTVSFSAVWGGRIDKVSTSDGTYPDGMGTSATGTATEVGALGIEEVRAGSIEHALSITLMDCAPWREFVWPASRSDGNGASPIPEGTMFRLDPALDVGALRGLSPIGRMVARAAQRYGFIVTDKSWSSIAFTAESGAPLAASGGDPDVWTTLLGGWRGWNVFAGFPWASMQVVEPAWLKAAPALAAASARDEVSATVEGVVGDLP